ncbi:protein ABA AND ROS SENSITIVE 1-like [Coffea arabica]|uniref:Zinc finger protein 830 n=1 Tax=Coffea arabica TaxID=13443 RepID=A0A6P6WBS2_COFAR|nr:zinc finger protein 830-like isoform X1 [Coffea arabica]XP_027111557.1 zinc finger protein 830-like isoform X1 [Coffea arabica]
MDAQAKKKALYRAKLNAQKKEKRIDSPLVRYNEHDQPVCKVCDVVLKSESLWPAHQASRKHHEAINNLKASAAAVNRANGAKPDPSKDMARPKTEQRDDLHNHKPEPSSGLPKPRPSSVLPSDFFDNHEGKRQKKVVAETQAVDPFASNSKLDDFTKNRIADTRVDIQFSKEKGLTSKKTAVPESKQVKGALPEGFFDDKDADLRARGITPVKLDVKDEYKEFEKLIQEDLQEIDNRLEEEEIDAAEMIEEAETVEQRTYRERVEMLRRKKMELKAARSSVDGNGIQDLGKKSINEESSSDDDSDENLTVDWRAKHL